MSLRRGEDNEYGKGQQGGLECPTSVHGCIRCPRVGGGTLEWFEDSEDAEKIFR